MIFKILQEALDKSDVMKITIDVELSCDFNEELDLSQKPIKSTDTLIDIIDDKSFDEWSNFESAIVGYIDQNYILRNISVSKNEKSLSEYIDFEVLNENGEVRNVIVDLRLSNHRSNSTTRNTRIRKIKTNFDGCTYRLIGITVNDENYKTYKDAYEFAKRVIDDTAANL